MKECLEAISRHSFCYNLFQIKWEDILNTNGMDSRKNLSNFIISLVAISFFFIVLLIISIGLFSHYQSKVKESKINELKQISTENTKIIQEWIESKKQEIATFSNDNRVKTLKNDEITQALTDFVKQSPDYELIFILGPDGKSLASSDGRVSDLSSRAFFKQSMSGKPVINGPLLSKNTKKILLGFSHPIINNNSIIGVIYALAPIENLSSRFAYSAPGMTGEVYIINSDGYLVTPSRFDDELKKMGFIKESSVLELRIDSFAEKQIRNGINGTSEYRNYLGNSVLGTYALLSEPDWGLIVEQGTDEAFTQIKTGAFILLLSIIILILITLILIFTTVIQYIFKIKKTKDEEISTA